MKKNTKIINVEYFNGYTLKIYFSDGHINLFDYRNLIESEYEESKKYSKISEFKKFKIVKNNTSIAWGEDWNMIISIHTLYSCNAIGRHCLPNNVSL